jgi:alpha-ribazole phosphatase
MDVPVAESYPDDLQAVRASLPRLTYARVISSPLQRCYRLATDLNFGSVDKDARLMELSFGAWEGLLWDEIPRPLSEYWTADVVNRAPPSGESFLQLITRVKNFLDDPMLWAAGPDVLVVTHAGVIRAMHHILSAVDYESCLRWPIHFGGYRMWEL